MQAQKAQPYSLEKNSSQREKSSQRGGVGGGRMRRRPPCRGAGSTPTRRVVGIPPLPSLV